MNRWTERTSLQLVNSLLERGRIRPETHRRVVVMIRDGAYDDALAYAMRRSAVE